MRQTDKTILCDTSGATGFSGWTQAPDTDTLGAPITTTPASGTIETITLTSGVSTINGTDLLCDTERMRIQSGGGTSSPSVMRGAYGTTPATHLAAAIVSVPGIVTYTCRRISQVPNHELIVRKSSPDINAVIIHTGGTSPDHDIFPGGGRNIILPDDTAGDGTVHLKFPGAGNTILILAGASASGPAGVAGPSSTSPGYVTAITLKGSVSGSAALQSEDYTIPDDQGNVYALIRVDYTPPSPLGSFSATHLYAELPDGSGSTPRSEIGTAVVGTDAVNPLPQPEDLGLSPYDLSIPIPPIYVNIPPLGGTATCRIYVNSASVDMENPLVLATEASPTPSATIDIPPAPAGPTPGIEFAPLPLNLSLVDGYPKYRLITGGTQQYRYGLQWDDPVTDPRYPALEGYVVVRDEPLTDAIGGVYDPGNSRTDTFRQDEISRVNDDVTHPGAQPYISQWWDLPTKKEKVTVWLDPYTNGGIDFNSIVPGVSQSVQFLVEPQSPDTDQLYTSDIRNLVCTARWDWNSDGQRALFFDTNWTEPLEDPSFGGAQIWLFNPDFPDGVALSGRSESPPQSPSITTGWPTSPDTWQLVVLSSDTSGNQNPYLAGLSPTVDVDVVPPETGAPLFDVTGFSVDAAYTAADNNGRPALLLTPTFTPPLDPKWNSIAFWANIPGYSWVLLGFPSTSGLVDQVAWEDIPKTTADWTFLAISLDVNGKDSTSNASPDPTSPPPGTPSFTLSIGPPPLGSAGQEQCDLVSGFSITLGGAIHNPDGTYTQSVTAQWTNPSDTRFGSLDLAIHYSQSVSPITPDVNPIKSRLVTSPSVFPWTPPNPSQTVRWYAISRDVNDRANTLVDAVTPHSDVTAGDTSQLDLSAAKLAALSAQFGTALQNTIIGDQLQIGGGNLNGTVNTAGTAISWASGDLFNSSIMLKGYPININGTIYPILSANSTTSITLDPSVTAGTHTGVNYSFGRPPQIRVFDRANDLVIWMGDDTQPGGSGLVGAWLGRGVRLGGPDPAHPVIDIDSTTGDTNFIQAGSTFKVTINNGDISVDDLAAVGLQTLIQAGFLQMFQSGSTRAFSELVRLYAYSNSTPFGPIIYMQQYRGVPTAASNSQSGDVFGGITASGSQGNNVDGQAGIFMQATETQTGSSNSGSQVVVQTSAIGSGQGSQRTIATFTEDGYLDILTGYKINGTSIGVGETNDAITAACSTLYSLTTGYVGVTGMSLSLTKTGVWKISAHLEFTAFQPDGLLSAQLLCAGTPQTGVIECQIGGVSGNVAILMQSRNWIFTSTTGVEAVVVQAMKQFALSGSAVHATNSILIAEFLHS